MLKFLLAFLIPASLALAQENPSAYEALRVIGTQLNRQLVNRYQRSAVRIHTTVHA